MNRCCGNCEHHKPIENEFVCDNENSEGYGLETSFDDYCNEYEERGQ